jgi:hypothetical protein
MRTYKSERYRVLPDHKRPGTWIVVPTVEQIENICLNDSYGLSDNQAARLSQAIYAAMPSESEQIAEVKEKLSTITKQRDKLLDNMHHSNTCDFIVFSHWSERKCSCGCFELIQEISKENE